MSNFPLYYYAFLTVIVFVVSLKLSRKINITLFSPFLIGLVLLAFILVAAHIPYHSYYQGNKVLNKLLSVSVVALAYPFYEQLPQIRRYWKSIVIISFFATLFSMLSGALFTLLLGGDKAILASVLPKSVTTPIAVAIATEINGEPSVTAVGVTIAGLTGSLFGLTLLNWLKIKNPKAIGLGMGAVSHALGTARLLESSIKMGSFSSISLVLCGVLSSFFAPLVMKIILLFMG
ncbi:LrgB family protein [Phocoenobacter skyensis]|uniref:LrgB family protein n=1 Tax=Phocoenobacter skyensis TaxID=97481 RepID=A0A1H7XCJ0_9PAST|nr:LrgB family protein [Pasteurella skyensis]MDP8079657.1 LrgB family protein [Pasteurella skyensis]MDP8085643.1 LrgB family protein [Pasteurella skyensis]MDP8170590.1 LrgB family protein [Pasteurella skyensis]MDP8174583.1 LrgB family protein [Pasteurella skyensis]MDP8176853.1 LrgB family protein [Pasteurella skyensis]